MNNIQELLQGNTPIIPTTIPVPQSTDPAVTLGRLAAGTVLGVAAIGAGLTAYAIRKGRELVIGGSVHHGDTGASGEIRLG